MTTDLMTRARAGDGDAFRELTEPHRRELQVHCYRMLGSFQDAEDALQDTLLAAWQGLEGFEGRASIRTWLYRIATNRCLNALRSASRRPAKEWDVPDGRTARADPPRRGRVARAVSRRPPRGCDRRAARPGGTLRADRGHLAGLRDRTAGPARRASAPCSSCARCSDTTPTRWPTCSTRPSTRSTASSSGPAPRLQRRLPPTGEREPAPAPDSPAEQALVARFVRAYDSGHIDALVALLTADVRVSMPPIPLEYHGRDAVARFFAASPCATAGGTTSCRRGPTVSWRSGPTSAPPPAASATATGLDVLTLTGDRICAITHFDSSVLPSFGLPRSLPAPGVGPQEAADGEDPEHGEDGDEHEGEEPGAGRAHPTASAAAAAAVMAGLRGRYTAARRSASASACSATVNGEQTEGHRARHEPGGAGGVRSSEAWLIRLTIAAPAAAMDSVIGRWLSIQVTRDRPSLRGIRRPTRSK